MTALLVYSDFSVSCLLLSVCEDPSVVIYLYVEIFLCVMIFQF